MKTIKTRHSFQFFHHIPSSSSQRNEAKRANYFEILRKIFIIPPHLYKGIQSALHNHKSTQFTNWLRLMPLLYLPFHRTIERIKLQTSAHFLLDFVGVIERTNFQSLYLYKSSFLCQVTTLTQNFFFFPVYIKATTNAFWWGTLLKFPHLIATRMVF